MLKNKSIELVKEMGCADSIWLSSYMRMYIEQYEKENIDMNAADALKDLIRVALDLCDIKGFLGTEEPTVIT